MSARKTAGSAPRLPRSAAAQVLVLVLVLGLASPPTSGSADADLPGLTAEVGSGWVKLTWSEPPSPTRPVGGYLVHRSSAGPEGPWRLLTPLPLGRPEFTDGTVHNDQDYWYKVVVSHDDKTPGPAGLVAARATADPVVVILTVGSRLARVNGVEVTLAAAPVVRRDRTLVPLRFVGESLGAFVDWVDSEKKAVVVLGPTVIKMWVGRGEAEVNGEKVPLDAPPALVGDFTMVPFRFIAEKLGASVHYQTGTGVITIRTEEADDHPAGADNRLAGGGSVPGRLKDLRDLDYYSFTVTEASIWTVRTRDLSGGLDTVLTVYAPDLDLVLGRNDEAVYDEGWPGWSEVRVVATEPGTYYVRVEGRRSTAGGYTLELFPTSDPDSSSEGAREVRPDAGGVTGFLDSPTDRDRYYFEARANVLHDIETLGLGEGSDTVLSLYAPDGRLLMTDDNWGSEKLGSRLRWLCPADGRYEFEVSGVATRGGTYTISLTTQPMEWWTGVAGAVATDVDSWAWFDWLVSPDEEDWYTFSAKAGVTYYVQTLGLSPGCDTKLRLTRDGVSDLAANDDYQGPASLIAWTADFNGPVYASVSSSGGNLGSYVFAVSTYGPKRNDTVETALPLSTDGRPVAGSLLGPGDVEWFSFEGLPGVTYVISTFGLSPACDTLIILFGDPPAKALAYNDNDPAGDSLQASRLEWVCPAAGTYYVAVVQAGTSGWGGYGLSVQVRTAGSGL